jgi:hypothetical protein
MSFENIWAGLIADSIHIEMHPLECGCPSFQKIEL